MKRVVLIGNPVGHSLSPKLHARWITEHGIDGEYFVRETKPDDLSEILESMRAGDLHGINVTLPFKEKVFEMLGMKTPAAKKTGAVNVVYRNEGGELVGDNTDVEGFKENLRFSVLGWSGTGKRALVLGAGGAARGVVWALLGQGLADIRVAGRTGAKTEALAAFFGDPRVHPVAWEKKGKNAADADLLVNATPLGLPGGEPLDFDTRLLKNDAVVYDLTYSQEPTPLLKQAFLNGRVPVDGLGMLVFQAMPAFERWFGVRPRFHEDLANTLKIND